MKKVKLYTSPTCVKCRMLKSIFASKGIEFEEITDIEVIVSKGIKFAPAVELEDGRIIGYEKAIELK